MAEKVTKKTKFRNSTYTNMENAVAHVRLSHYSDLDMIKILNM